MTRKRSQFNDDESAMTRNMDKLKAFDDFQENILPALQKDLRDGMGSEELRKKYASYVQAAQLTQALTDPKAAGERKDVLDRLEGKATEKKEISHRLEKLPEEELDALLLSELEDVEDAE